VDGGTAHKALTWRESKHERQAPVRLRLHAHHDALVAV
jgi:hypothetical protein